MSLTPDQERLCTAAQRAHQAFEAVHAEALDRTRPLFDKRSEALAAALAAGVKGPELAERLGLSFSRVYQLAREADGPRLRAPRSEVCPSCGGRFTVRGFGRHARVCGVDSEPQGSAAEG